MELNNFINHACDNVEMITASLLSGRNGYVSDEEIDEAVNLAIRIRMRSLARCNSLPVNLKLSMINEDGETSYNKGKQWNTSDIQSI